MGKSTINVIFNSYVSLPEGIYLHVILLYYVSFISSNVNPGLANPGWLIVVVPPKFCDFYGYWNGTPPTA